MRQFFAIVALLIFAQSPVGSEPFLYSSQPFQILKAANCGCRLAWTVDLRQSGFLVTIDTVPSEQIARYRLGPRHDQHSSCHIGFIDGYVIEGHIAARQIQQLLDLQPDLVGLSAPLMPIGSLGGETTAVADPSSVIFIRKDGTTGLFSDYVAKQSSQ